MPTQLNLVCETPPASPVPATVPKTPPSGATEFKLIHGDCVAEMRELAAESVDVVVTSPPYNLGIKYGKYEGTKTRDEFLAWTVEWCREVKHKGVRTDPQTKVTKKMAFDLNAVDYLT